MRVLALSPLGLEYRIKRHQDDPTAWSETDYSATSGQGHRPQTTKPTVTMNATREIFIRESEALIDELTGRLDKGEPIGSFSPSIYDTAWLARIRTRDTPSHWLFPQSFIFLLRTQEPDGGWSGNGSQIDGILSTLASLVALKEHHATHVEPQIVNGFHPEDGLEECITKAENILSTRLQQWDVEATVHVGFEVVVPALLNALEIDHGTKFDFHGRQKLLSLNRQKLSKLRPEIVYGPQITTLVHSLEALVGCIDFDRVAHHLDQHGSMLASPASTAAYLMHSNKWDDRAEAYLRTVVSSGSGAGSGGVPGAFPSATFELSWILSTLLKATPSLAELPQALQIGQYLKDQLDSHGGVVGWDTALLEDADDTAKVLLSCSLLGLPSSPKRMIDKFEGPDHFRTYQYERNGSFSTNCNVLTALLHSQTPADYLKQIIKVTKFSCREYLSGTINDKWNLYDGYSIMLLAQALSKLLQTWDTGMLIDLPEDLIREQVALVASHILVQTLQQQRSDGSWRWNTASRETSAYAILTIKSLASLPWVQHLDAQVQTAVTRASAYLILNYDKWDSNEHLWVAKTTYALPPVAKAYIIAALCADTSYDWGHRVTSLFTVPGPKQLAMASFFSRLPMFFSDAPWHLEADLALGSLYKSQLSRLTTGVFPPNPCKETNNKYLDYIPFTWIATNRKNGFPLAKSILWEMMKISVLIYQLDELMETACGQLYVHENGMEQLRAVVQEACTFRDDDPPYKNEHGCETNGTTTILQATRTALQNFTSHVLSDPSVTKSAPHIRNQLRRLLLTSILAHVDHEEQNILFREKGAVPGGYHDWIQSTSAPNTQAPWTILFFTFLASQKGEPFVQGPKEEYLFAAVTRHLSALCRQQNDYGSVVRDRREGNLNSVDFFLSSSKTENCSSDDATPTGGSGASDAAHANGTGAVKPGKGDDDIEKAKQDLLYIINHERDCLHLTLARLQVEMIGREEKKGKKKMKCLMTFVDTVELYGQIYGARDISNKVIR
ncbi:hypothetical protein QBC43DRAFT_318479 [Cladorrhinum sp. PSN259]|nr:hypothetical protein QBC43DRAFT_318479 [Cladorrhinum sp. PSN259]